AVQKGKPLFYRVPVLAFAVGVACSYEPGLGLVAATSVGAYLVTRVGPRAVYRDFTGRPELIAWTAVGAALGLIPLAVQRVRPRPWLALAPSPFGQWIAEHVDGAHIIRFDRIVVEQTGLLWCGLAGLGFLLGLRPREARPLVVACGITVAGGAVTALL